MDAVMTEGARTKNRYVFKPISIQSKDAQVILNCGATHVHNLGVTGVLTRIWPKGAGIGKRCYYLTEEVEEFARTRDPEAMKAYRQRKEEERKEEEARSSRKRGGRR